MEVATELQSSYENLLYHIILPHSLQQERSQDYEKQNMGLLSNMVEVIETCSVPPATSYLFKSLEQTHMQRSPEVITGEINALKPGNSFAMFVQRQNCALMIHMPVQGNSAQVDENTTVIVSTFLGSLHPKQIYKNLYDLNVRN